MRRVPRASVRRALASLVALTVASAATASESLAQETRGRLEGTVTDSVHAMPLAGVVVSATRLDRGSDSAVVAATADERGRFRFDRLAAGEYAVSFASALLDSLEYGGPPHRVAVAADGVTRVALAIPSGATLRRLACPGMTLPKGTGVLSGIVTDADTDTPLAGAQVAAAWTELTFDRGVLMAMTLEHSGGAITDSLGEYRLCGVPTDSWLLVQVQSRERFGSAVQVTIPDGTGVLVRHLSFSAEGARTLATLDSAQRDTTRVLAPLVGTATLAGIVRGAHSRPIVDAQVRLVGAASTARTDANGWFTLTGLPAGTHELEVRALGYPAQRRPVELRRGATTHHEMQLEEVAALDTVRTVATRSPYATFESNRRTSLTGLFITQDEIERRHAQQASELLSSLPAFRVVGQGPDATVVSARDGCRPNVVIDYMQFQEINLIPPSLIAGIEAYPTTNGAPAEFTNLCGVIRIWVKR